METFLTIEPCTRANLLFEVELIICRKMDLALNNQQRLICHKNLYLSLTELDELELLNETQ